MRFGEPCDTVLKYMVSKKWKGMINKMARYAKKTKPCMRIMHRIEKLRKRKKIIFLKARSHYFLLFLMVQLKYRLAFI